MSKTIKLDFKLGSEFDEIVKELNSIQSATNLVRIYIDYISESDNITLSHLAKLVKLCNDNEILKKVNLIFFDIINIYFDAHAPVQLEDISENLNIHFYTKISNNFLKINNMYPNYLHTLDTIVMDNDFSDIINQCNSNKSKNVVLIINFDEKCTFNNDELDESLEIFFNGTNNKIFLKCNSHTKIEKYLIIKIKEFNNFDRFSCLSLDRTQKHLKKLTRESSRIQAISSLNTTKYEDIYKFFLENYKKSFFLPYKKEENADKRAELYIKSIMEYLLESMLFKKHNFTSDKFVKYLISKSLEFKESVQLEYDRNDVEPIVPNKTIVAMYHGNPTDNIIEVPKDCIICFITPINYLKLSSRNKLFDILKDLSLSTFPKTFKKSPHCYSRVANAFRNSNTFLPGQYYNDIELSWNKDFSGALGTYLFTYENDEIPFNKRYSKKNYITKSNSNKKLSELIIEQKMSGIIIVIACRSIELKITDISTNIYRYEHFCNILNKSTWFYDNPENYYKCGSDILLIKDASSVKVSDSDNKTASNAIKSLIRGNPIKNEGNRSLGFRQNIPTAIGLSEEVLKILFDTIKDKDTRDSKIFDAFNQLDELFTKKTYNPVLLEKLSNFLRLIYANEMLYMLYVKQITRNLEFNSSFNIIDMFISFVLYMCVIKQIKFYCDNFGPEDFIIVKNINFSGCKLKTEDLEKIIPYIDNYYNIDSIYLDNNEITKIPVELGKLYIKDIYLNNNPIDFTVDSSNPDKYINEFHFIESSKYPNVDPNLLNIIHVYYRAWKKSNNRNNNYNWKVVSMKKSTRTSKKQTRKTNKTY